MIQDDIGTYPGMFQVDIGVISNVISGANKNWSKKWGIAHGVASLSKELPNQNFVRLIVWIFLAF